MVEISKNPNAPSAPSPIPTDMAYDASGFIPSHLLQVSCWPASLDRLEKKLVKTLGPLPAIGSFTDTGDTRCYATNHATWLIETSNNDVAGKLSKLPARDAAVTDLSGGYVFFKINGPHAGLKLAKGAILDFSPAIFASGTLKQTAIHHIQVLIARQAKDQFLISVSRSFSDELKSWFHNN